MGNGVTTLQHNPLVGRGGGRGREGKGGGPQGGKVKQESLAWFPLKELARPEVSQLQSISFSSSSIGTSLNLKSYH